MGDDRAAADLAALGVIFAQGSDRQGLRGEIIDDDDFIEPEFGNHPPRPHDPGTIGKVDLVAIDGSSHRQDRRTRPHGRLVQNFGLDRRVERRMI
jgi:hypothetical protein